MAELGSVVDATISGVMKFGVFVEFGDGESGLVHISELSYEYVPDINEFIKKDDKVKAKVIKIDDDGKVSLSIRQSKPREKAVRPRPEQLHRPDSFDWTARNEEELSFEDRLSRFKHESEEILRDNKRRLDNKRSGGYSRKGR